MNTNMRLQQMIIDGKTEQAMQMMNVRDYHDAEDNAYTVLQMERATLTLIDAALEAFVKTRINSAPEHGYWVHSLSHFTKMLWERRLIDWIQRLNLIAFTGANELWDDNCSSRLVNDFANNALWDDDPQEFHLTPEMIGWMNWDYCQYAQERITAGPFGSEADYLRWQLNQPKAYTASDYESQTDLVSLEKIDAITGRLAELGEDTSMIEDLKRDLLTKQLHKLEAKLAAATVDWRRECAEAGIQKTRAALDTLV